MILLGQLVLAVIAATLVWKISQLVRAPRNRALLAIVGCQTTAILNNVFVIPTVVHTVDGWLVPGTANLLFNGLLAGFYYGLGCFYLYASHREEPERITAGYLRRRVRLDTAIYVGVLAAMALCLALTPPALRAPMRFMDADLRASGFATFYLVNGIYLLYATASAVVLARALASATRHRSPRTARGLRLAAVGLAACLIGPTLRVTMSVLALLGAGGSRSPTIVGVVGTVTATVGVVLFALGVVYPLVVDAVITARQWLPGLRTYLRLRPLWRALLEEFPRNELPVSLRERPGRRVTETLDCLETLGPYMAPADPGATIADDAVRVRDALRRSASGQAPVAGNWEPGAVVMSAVRGYAGDVTQLVRLADAFGRLPR